MTKANRNAGTNTSYKKERTKSIYLNLAYQMNDFTPFAQYFSDKKDFEGLATSNYKKNAFALGVGYKPYNDVNLRYHLVYTNSKKELDSTLSSSTKKVNESNVLLGFKADI